MMAENTKPSAFLLLRGGLKRLESEVHEWVQDAHAMLLDAVKDAHAEGYVEGYVAGMEEAARICDRVANDQRLGRGPVKSPVSFASFINVSDEAHACAAAIRAKAKEGET